jgi:hypothetical protein
MKYNVPNHRLQPTSLRVLFVTHRRLRRDVGRRLTKQYRSKGIWIYVLFWSREKVLASRMILV